jgi:hypothetical protein
MILKKTNSRVYTINLFSDYLLTKIPNTEESIFSVADCKNFIIIKGKTSHKEILDISSITKEFNEKYEPETPISHTIDLIEYKSDLSSPKKFKFFFGKKLHKEDSLFSTSEFPYGYSNNQGKLLYFYFKHIVDKIPTNYPFNWIIFNVEVSEKNEIDFTIEDDYLNNNGDILKSAILDCFDFNLTVFESILNKMDLEKYILNPSEETLLDDISVNDFIII